MGCIPAHTMYWATRWWNGLDKHELFYCWPENLPSFIKVAEWKHYGVGMAFSRATCRESFWREKTYSVCPGYQIQSSPRKGKQQQQTLPLLIELLHTRIQILANVMLHKFQVFLNIYVYIHVIQTFLDIEVSVTPNTFSTQESKIKMPGTGYY